MITPYLVRYLLVPSIPILPYTWVRVKQGSKRVKSEVFRCFLGKKKRAPARRDMNAGANVVSSIFY